MFASHRARSILSDTQTDSSSSTTGRRREKRTCFVCSLQRRDFELYNFHYMDQWTSSRSPRTRHKYTNWEDSFFSFLFLLQESNSHYRMMCVFFLWQIKLCCVCVKYIIDKILHKAELTRFQRALSILAVEFIFHLYVSCSFPGLLELSKNSYTLIPTFKKRKKSAFVWDSFSKSSVTLRKLWSTII